MFAISIDENRRCLSATFPQYAQTTDILVETLPDGDLYDYILDENLNYVYNPAPKPVEPERPPTVEERLSDCELVLAEIMGGAI